MIVSLTGFDVLPDDEPPELELLLLVLLDVLVADSPELDDTAETAAGLLCSALIAFAKSVGITFVLTAAFGYFLANVTGSNVPPLISPANIPSVR